MAVCEAGRTAGTCLGGVLDDQLWNALPHVEAVPEGSAAGQSDVHAVAGLFVHLLERVDLVDGVPREGLSHHGAVRLHVCLFDGVGFVVLHGNADDPPAVQVPEGTVQPGLHRFLRESLFILERGPV